MMMMTLVFFFPFYLARSGATTLTKEGVGLKLFAIIAPHAVKKDDPGQGYVKDTDFIEIKRNDRWSQIETNLKTDIDRCRRSA